MTKQGKIVLVPTPIGNLGDISFRAKEAFENCDVVYCEDTRVTAKLLSSFSINKPLFRMDENSISEHVQKIIDDCMHEKCVCYCSDAGMPGISDPGSRIVSACRKADVDVEVLPGANACLTALVSSGFNCDHFFFEGFLPKKKNQKEKRLQELLDLNFPIVIYESPKRVSDTIATIADLAQKRRVCVAKELTKLHEEVVIARAEEMLEALSFVVLKGEFVIVIDGTSKDESESEKAIKFEKAKTFAQKQCERGVAQSLIRQDLVDFFDVSKNDAYDISLNV